MSAAINGVCVPPVNWAALVDRIRAGDEAAEEALFRFLIQGVRCMINRRLGPADQHTMDGLAGAVLSEVFAGIRGGALREPSSLPAYTRTIVHRRVADEIGKRERDRREQPIQEDFVDTSESADESIARKERAAALRDALMTLSARERELVMRFYLDEQRPADIRHDMGLSLNQFRTLKSRVRTKLEGVRKKPRLMSRLLPFLTL